MFTWLAAGAGEINQGMAGFCIYVYISYLGGEYVHLYLVFLHLSFSTTVSHETWASRSLAQPSRRFGPLRSLSLWRGAHFRISPDLAQPSRHFGHVRSVLILTVKEILCRDLDKEILFRELARRPCPRRPCPRRPLIEILYRDLVKRTEVLLTGHYRELEQRSYFEISYTILLWRPLTDTL